jgi:hypothetical protein
MGPHDVEAWSGNLSGRTMCRFRRQQSTIVKMSQQPWISAWIGEHPRAAHMIHLHDNRVCMAFPDHILIFVFDTFRMRLALRLKTREAWRLGGRKDAAQGPRLSSFVSDR